MSETSTIFSNNKLIFLTLFQYFFWNLINFIIKYYTNRNYSIVFKTFYLNKPPFCRCGIDKVVISNCV